MKTVLNQAFSIFEARFQIDLLALMIYLSEPVNSRTNTSRLDLKAALYRGLEGRP